MLMFRSGFTAAAHFLDAAILMCRHSTADPHDLQLILNALIMKELTLDKIDARVEDTKCGISIRFMYV